MKYKLNKEQCRKLISKKEECFEDRVKIRGIAINEFDEFEVEYDIINRLF